MRVLIACEYVSFGGTRSFLFHLLKLHIRQGIETSVLIGPNQCDDEALEFFSKNDIKVFKGKEKPRFFRKLSVLSWLFDVYLLLKPLKKFRPDLIFVSNSTPGEMLGSLLLPVPVVFFMHTYPRKFNLLRKLMLCMAKFLNNKFVTVSHYSANTMSKNMGLPVHCIEVIHNSFQRCVQPSPSKTPLILTLGHVIHYKNPKVWLEVAQKVHLVVPEARFVWLGGGPELNEMRHQAISEGCADYVSFKGYIKEVEKFYAVAWVYFQPSLKESHGLSVLDAMASKIPCVSSNVGGLPESIVDGETGYLCNVDDVDSFAGKIIQLINDSNLRKDMGMSGYNRAHDLFPPNTQEDKLIAMYRSQVNAV